jgi:hypothetical protein
MPATRNADGLYIGAGSDSDDSLHAEDDRDFEESARQTRAKGKGKAIKRTKDKGKGKAKEVRYVSSMACLADNVLAILRLGSSVSEIVG